MRTQLIPVLVLLVLPVLYLAWRLRLGERLAVRILGGGTLVLAVVYALPYEGLDFVYVKRIDLFIAAGVALLLLARGLGIGGLRRPKRFLAVLALTALFSLTVYWNFFSFHGERTFVHLHDVAHYYLGSKYYAEAGYEDLYVAMLRAESELHGKRFLTPTARDLRTYEQVDIAELLRKESHRVKAAFTDERWNDFKKDVALFRDALGHQYAGVLADHGFNATPAWALVGATLARQVPGGSRTGVLLLCLLDVALLAGVFAAVGWAFGARTALLSLTLFCVIFGANFGWTGGAFLRYLWFFGVIVGTCCLHKRRDAAAGALFAGAVLLRIFPLFFVLTVVYKGAVLAWRRRRWPRRQVVFAGSFLATAAVLFALTGLLPRGFSHWSEFRAQMKLHVANISPNVVGLTDLLAFRPSVEEKVTQEEFNAIKARRQKIHTGQLLLVFVPMVILAARLGRFSTDLGAVALALPLLHASLSLASYYQVFLVVLVLWQRNSMRHLALIFAVEAASFSLMLFEDRDALLYIYRSVLLLFLYLALFLPALRRELRTPPP